MRAPNPPSAMPKRRPHNDAFPPAKGTGGSAAFDIRSCENLELLPGTWVVKIVVKTGLAIQLPVGTYGHLASRSSLAFKFDVVVMGGVIDRDYTGEIKVILLYHGILPYCVGKGDRICQLIVHRIADPEPVEVEKLGRETKRGSGGFGSTGK